MVEDVPSGPAELVLMASLARRHFIDGISKIDIAEQVGLSRFKVARLLDKARATGLVRIEIGIPGSIDLDLSTRLQALLGLRHALVLDIPEDQAQSLREQLGGAAANLLDEIVTPDDVVGLAWARSSMAMSAALKHLARCTVVQLTGALPRLEPEDSSIELEDSSIELVRNVAHVCGGPAYYFYAPMIVATPQTAQSLRQLPEVARAMACFDSVTKAVVGVGSWDPTCSTVYDALEPSERGALGRLGVHAEVSGILIDIDGSPVPAPLIQRTIAITAQQLRAVPEVIAIAYGSAKAGAVLASIRGGLVKSLVTHRSLGHALIEAASAADGGVDGAAEGAASRAGVEGRPGGT